MDDALQYNLTLPNKNWLALQILGLYRFVLATILLSIFQFKSTTQFMGTINPVLYHQTVWIYLTFSSIALIASLIKVPPYSKQIHSTVFIDIVCLLVILHLSGGIISGLSMLFIVIIAAYCLLTPGRYSYLMTVFASIGILIQQQVSYNIFQQNAFVHSSMLIAGLFSIAIVTNMLAKAAKTQERIAFNKEAHLSSSQQLNSLIIDNLEQGVLVLDAKDNILIVNLAARRLLGCVTEIKKMDDLPTALAACYNNWQYRKNNRSMILTSTPFDCRITLENFGYSHFSGTLIFINDINKEKQRAQDLKLTSLGQMAANIAHEIRNPLGAISHASQLIAESDKLCEDELKLNTIILQHVKRMDKIINNVLSISKATPPHQEEFALHSFLQDYCEELKSKHPNVKVLQQFNHEQTIVSFDISQLRQVLDILCENAIRYLKKTPEPILRIIVKNNTISNTVDIDVMDNGSGISAEQLKHLFEPFFTTESSGTGLGLYIAKELCQMNHVNLSHIPNQVGCIFRIAFPTVEEQ